MYLEHDFMLKWQKFPHYAFWSFSWLWLRLLERWTFQDIFCDPGSSKNAFLCNFRASTFCWFDLFQTSKIAKSHEDLTSKAQKYLNGNFWNHKNSFYVKSEWQKNYEISTLWSDDFQEPENWHHLNFHDERFYCNDIATTSTKPSLIGGRGTHTISLFSVVRY